MKLEHGSWSATKPLAMAPTLSNSAQLVLYFGEQKLLTTTPVYDNLRALYPSAIIAGCTTGGEILDRDLIEDSVVFSAIHFEKSEVSYAVTPIKDIADSYRAGQFLAQELLKKDNLVGILLLSEGLEVDGTALSQGVNASVDLSKVTVTGGLAGDGGFFVRTFVGCNAAPQDKIVAAIGFYGDNLRITWGSHGGWQIFGPERSITKSEGNMMFELDGKDAIELYKRYLGDEADKLPESALNFPLAIWPPEADADHAVIRTILRIDQEKRALVFTGDIPQGWSARLMWGRFDDIIEGAKKSAQSAKQSDLLKDHPSLSIIISCIGRKSLMGQRVVEELEECADVLGDDNTRIGFYSYGEIAPHQISTIPVLHNQTMTVTTISES